MATLEFNDGTIIAFDNYFDDDDPGSGWIDIYKEQRAHVIAGTDRPDTYIWQFEYLAQEPEQPDDEGNYYFYTHGENVARQQFLAFDNLAYLTSYNIRTFTKYDYYDIPDVEYRSERLEVGYVDANGVLTNLGPDATAASTAVLFEQPHDRAGVLWVDEASSQELKVTLASVSNHGDLVRRSERIDTSAIPAGPTPVGPEVLAAASLIGGETAVGFKIGGGVQLGQFSSRFDLLGSLTAIEGELAGLVGLPDGGFVLGNIVRDATGTGATLYVRGYDEDGLPTSPLSIHVANFQGASLSLQDDGTVAIGWQNGSTSFSQDYLPAGITAQGDDDPNVLTGSTWRDALRAKGGTDMLFGRGGDDILNGGEGNDVLVGGYGADTLNGGLGTDVVRYETKVRIDLADPGMNTGEGAGDILISIEQIRGSESNDRIEGDGANNSFQGRGGDDFLSGGAGNDILVGNAGADRLRGGTGADQFRFDLISDGGDTVADFETGIDKIGIRANGFDIESVTVVSGAAPVAVGDGPTFLFTTGTGLLSFDADGTGAQGAVNVATLTNVHALSSTDFALIG